MRLVATLTRTKTSQNYQVKTCGVGRCLGHFSGQWVCYAGTEAMRDWEKQFYQISSVSELGVASSLVSVGRGWFLHMALCLCWGVGEVNDARHLLFSWWGVALNASSQAQAPRRRNNLPPAVCPRCSSDPLPKDLPLSCLPAFSLGASTEPSGLYPSQTHWLLIL